MTDTDTRTPTPHGYKDIGEEGVADESTSAEHVDIPGGPPGSAADPALREAMEAARDRQRRREEDLD